MSTLANLQDRFPSAMLIKPSQAGALLNQSRQSSYNQVSQGRFPVPLVIDHLGRKMVRLHDLASYLDGLAVVPAGQFQERRAIIGRPTKFEQVEAQRMGITVPQLRAQKPLAPESREGGAI